MRTIKAIPAHRATPSGAKSGAFSLHSAPLAQKLTFSDRNNFTPSEFAGLLKERFGILVSERWVQRRCQCGQIVTIRLPHFGRRLIPATEAARFAATLSQTTEASA